MRVWKNYNEILVLHLIFISIGYSCKYCKLIIVGQSESFYVTETWKSFFFFSVVLKSNQRNIRQYGRLTEQ